MREDPDHGATKHNASTIPQQGVSPIFIVFLRYQVVKDVRVGSPKSSA
jgi:hypothetical protein